MKKKSFMNMALDIIGLVVELLVWQWQLPLKVVEFLLQFVDGSIGSVGRGSSVGSIGSIQ
jgi:hypothetical protein